VQSAKGKEQSAKRGVPGIGRLCALRHALCHQRHALCALRNRYYYRTSGLLLEKRRPVCFCAVSKERHPHRPSRVREGEPVNSTAFPDLPAPA
jgi:hypothetical protein